MEAVKAGGADGLRCKQGAYMASIGKVHLELLYYCANALPAATTALFLNPIIDAFEKACVRLKCACFFYLFFHS